VNYVHNSQVVPIFIHTMRVLTTDLRCSVLEESAVVLAPAARSCDLRLMSNVLPLASAARCAACLTAAADGGGGGRSRAATSPL